MWIQKWTNQPDGRIQTSIHALCERNIVENVSLDPKMAIQIVFNTDSYDNHLYDPTGSEYGNGIVQPSVRGLESVRLAGSWQCNMYPKVEFGNRILTSRRCSFKKNLYAAGSAEPGGLFNLLTQVSSLGSLQSTSTSHTTVISVIFRSRTDPALVWSWLFRWRWCP